MKNQPLHPHFALGLQPHWLGLIEKLFYLVGLVLFLLLLVNFPNQFLNLQFEQLCNLATLAGVVVFAMLLRVFPRRIWSAVVVYLGMFSLFHFGLTFAYGLGLPFKEELEYEVSHWFYTSTSTIALWLAVVGMVAYAVGAVLASLASKPEHRPPNPTAALNRNLLVAGLALLICSLAGWMAITLGSGGLALFTASYESFLTGTEGKNIHWVYYGIGLGLTLLAAADPSRLRTLGFVLFGCWSLVALPIGLRGEVLFPLLTALVVIARNKIPCSPLTFVLLVGLGLCAVSGLRTIRTVGIEGLHQTQVSASPVDAVAEMGCSLRPIVAVLNWTENGDDFLYGASYWAPFERPLALAVPGMKRQEAENDTRIMNILVNQREGPIGFSPVAEGYYNLGLWGVVGAMFVTGWLIGKLDGWPASQMARVWLGATFLPLLIQIRNSFVAVPFQILAGLAVVTLLWLAAAQMERARRRPRGTLRTHQPLPSL